MTLHFKVGHSGALPRVTLHDSLFLRRENRMCPAIGHYRVPLKGAANPAGGEGEGEGGGGIGVIVVAAALGSHSRGSPAKGR